MTPHGFAMKHVDGEDGFAGTGTGTSVVLVAMEASALERLAREAHGPIPLRRLGVMAYRFGYAGLRPINIDGESCFPPWAVLLTAATWAWHAGDAAGLLRSADRDPEKRDAYLTLYALGGLKALSAAWSGPAPRRKAGARGAAKS